MQRSASIFSASRKKKASPKVEPLAIKLQREGDQFRSKRNCTAAADKYEQSVKIDPSNIPVWHSLAACHLELHKYEEVIADARSVLVIEEANARAWCYLSEVYLILEDWGSYFAVFDRAHDILKGKHSDQKLLEDLLLRHSEAKKLYKIRRKPQRYLLPKDASSLQSLPRILAISAAAEFEDKKTAEPAFATSAWVILEACGEFTKGYELMKIPPPPKDSFEVPTRSMLSLALMSNGIVRDPRCFYMDSEDEFMDQFVAQAEYEVRMTSAWGLDVPEEVIKTEALDRLDRLGWDSVRPGLAVTIRASIINAQMSAGFNQFGQAACLLWRALNLLDWGRERWSKVDRKQRGAIFDVSWIRSVRVLYGGMLVSAYEQTKNEKSKPYNLRQIMNVAQRIQDDCRDRPMKTVTSSGKPSSAVYLLSYQSYPEGKARMCKGYYFYELGRQKIMNGEDRAEANRDLRFSANEYQNALPFFPKDDESYSICLLDCLQSLFLAKTPLRETSAIISDLRGSWQRASEIWIGSSFSTTGGRERIERLFQFQDNALKAVAEKAGAIGDRIVPGRWGDRIL